MPRDSIANILRVSILLCLACAICVSVAAVGLRKTQERNARLDRQKNVLVATGYDPAEVAQFSGEAITEKFQKNITTYHVEVGTGKEVPASALPDGENYDPRMARQSSDLKKTLSDEAAERLGIKDVAPYYSVYEVHKDGTLDCFVIPIMGQGLWSTIYGYLALEPDMKTVRGINFYEHGETPGLGGEIENPDWTAIWPGKVAVGESGEPRIEVIKGSVGPNTADRERKIDGLAGATITSNGVEHAVNFWLSDDGFGKFLDRHKQ